MLETFRFPPLLNTFRQARKDYANLTDGRKLGEDLANWGKKIPLLEVGAVGRVQSPCSETLGTGQEEGSKQDGPRLTHRSPTRGGGRSC